MFSSDDLLYLVFLFLVFFIVLTLTDYFDKEMSKRKKEQAEIYINSEKYDIFKKCYEIDDIFYCERTDIDV